MAALSQRDARLSEPGAHPGPPADVPAEATCVLHRSFAFPGQKSLLQSPALLLLLRAWGQPTWRNHRDCSFPKAGARVTPMYPLICIAFGGVCCSPVKWMTNCRTFRGNQIKTPLKLLPFAWLHASTESLWEQVLQCLPALMGTCVAAWGHSGSAQKVDYRQHMQTEVYSSEGAP